MGIAFDLLVTNNSFLHRQVETKLNLQGASISPGFICNGYTIVKNSIKLDLKG